MSELLGSLFRYLLAALGLVTLVLVVQSTFATDNTNTAASELTQITQGISQPYRGNGQTNVMSISNAAIITGGVVPSAMLNGDGMTIAGPWTGSVVTVAPAGTTRYEITWTNVPNSACAKFARSQKGDVVVLNGGTPYSPSDVTDITRSCGTWDGGTVSFWFDV